MWKPIDTAPRNGTSFLATSEGTDWVGVIAHTDVKNFKGGHPWRDNNSFGRITWRKPTHWQPLPAPLPR